uniref:Uncharacterized protein n=1 Tax=Rangifer tarandus platyrhynchus TaxID=3082113 RepID=A0ACB0FL43_RANTA|nr:unnamed protein product [Rangifer tarandus platyrhynchus]
MSLPLRLGPPPGDWAREGCGSHLRRRLTLAPRPAIGSGRCRVTQSHYLPCRRCSRRQGRAITHASFSHPRGARPGKARGRRGGARGGQRAAGGWRAGGLAGLLFAHRHPRRLPARGAPQARPSAGGPSGEPRAAATIGTISARRGSPWLLPAGPEREGVSPVL